MLFFLVLKDGKYLILTRLGYSRLSAPKTVIYVSECRTTIESMRKDLSTQPLLVLPKLPDSHTVDLQKMAVDSSKILYQQETNIADNQSNKEYTFRESKKLNIEVSDKCITANSLEIAADPQDLVKTVDSADNILSDGDKAAAVISAIIDLPKIINQAANFVDIERNKECTFGEDIHINNSDKCITVNSLEMAADSQDLAKSIDTTENLSAGDKATAIIYERIDLQRITDEATNFADNDSNQEFTFRNDINIKKNDKCTTNSLEIAADPQDLVKTVDSADNLSDGDKAASVISEIIDLPKIINQAENFVDIECNKECTFEEDIHFKNSDKCITANSSEIAADSQNLAKSIDTTENVSAGDEATTIIYERIGLPRITDEATNFADNESNQECTFGNDIDLTKNDKCTTNSLEIAADPQDLVKPVDSADNLSDGDKAAAVISAIIDLPKIINQSANFVDIKCNKKCTFGEDVHIKNSDKCITANSLEMATDPQDLAKSIDTSENLSAGDKETAIIYENIDLPRITDKATNFANNESNPECTFELDTNITISDNCITAYAQKGSVDPCDLAKTINTTDNLSANTEIHLTVPTSHEVKYINIYDDFCENPEEDLAPAMRSTLFMIENYLDSSDKALIKNTDAMKIDTSCSMTTNTRSVNIEESNKDSESDTEDPYADSEFDDKEYLPSSEEKTSSSRSSSTYSMKSDAISILSKIEYNRGIDIKRLKNIRKSLKFDDENDSQDNLKDASNDIILEDAEAEACSLTLLPPRINENKAKSKKLTGKLEVDGDCVKVYSMFPLHAGCYKGHLTQRDGESRLSTILEYPKGFVKHICKYEHDKKIVAQLERSGMKYHLELHCCFPAGKYLKGYEMYMSFLKCYVCGLSVSKEDNDVSLTMKDLKEHKVKRHCCPYCSKIITNIARHMKRQHSNEAEVKRALEMEPNSTNRKEILKKLRLRGDHEHNKKDEGNNKVILVRKPTVNCVSGSRHCDECNGYFMTKGFSKHYRRCKGIPKNVKLNLRPDKPQHHRSNEILYDQDTSGAQLLLDSVRQDEVGIIAKNDPLLGKTLAAMYCPDACRFELKKSNASQQLRRMARVLLEIRKLDNDIKCWSDLLKPERYNLLTKGIRIVAGMENTSIQSHASKPQLALQYGPILTRLINQLLIDTLKDENLTVDEKNKRKEELKQLLTIHEMDFRTQISSKALTIRNVRKVYKDHDLPQPMDIQKLTLYLINLSEQSFNSLRNNGFNYQTWRTMGESLLCQIVVFNRRRTGEASKMFLENYYQKKNVDENDYRHLTRLQILLAKQYSVVYIAGKRVRAVPILINQKQQQQLDLFIKYRDKAGFTEENPHLFPAHSRRDPYMKAAIYLRKFSEECGAERPELLRGSYLRRQVATVSQYLSLSESEIQELADFMGHDVNVHKKHYRQPSAMLEITKISRFLSVVGDTNINRHKGKSLDELELEMPPEEYDINDLDDEEPNFHDDIQEQSTLKEPHIFAKDAKMTRFTARPNSPLTTETSSVNSSFDDMIVENEQSTDSEPKNTSNVSSGTYRRKRERTPENTAPRKKLSKKVSLKKETPKKPLTQEILQIIQQQGSPHAYRYKRRVLSRVGWAPREKEFMRIKFGRFLKKDASLPSKDYLKEVLKANPGALHESRTADNMYAYIQNEKRKLIKTPSRRPPGRPSNIELMERAAALKRSIE